MFEWVFFDTEANYVIASVRDPYRCRFWSQITKLSLGPMTHFAIEYQIQFNFCVFILSYIKF